MTGHATSSACGGQPTVQVRLTTSANAAAELLGCASGRSASQRFNVHIRFDSSIETEMMSEKPAAPEMDYPDVLTSHGLRTKRDWLLAQWVSRAETIWAGQPVSFVSRCIITRRKHAGQQSRAMAVDAFHTIHNAKLLLLAMRFTCSGGIGQPHSGRIPWH